MKHELESILETEVAMMSWFGGGGCRRRWMGNLGGDSGRSGGNVRAQGLDCRVPTCSPPGPTVQAIISHYSLTCIQTHMCTHG